MTGAMYAAIAGLRAHMQELSVIGNNVANVNTNGYKAHRTTFKEAIYSTVTGGSNGTDSIGGVNPSQIGFGCSVGTIDLMMSTANYAPTGNNLDCMIDGDGFFMVGDKPNATTAEGGTTFDETAPTQLNLSRMGDFKFDSQGYLTDGQGSVVYGWVTVADPADDAADADAGVRGRAAGVVDKSTKNPSYSTQLVPIRLPLAAKEPTVGPNEEGYIAAGTAIYPGVNETSGFNVYDTGTGDAALSTGKPVELDTMSIDPNTGMISGVNSVTKEQVIVGYLAIGRVTNPSGVTHVGGHYYRAMEGAGECRAASIKDAVTGYVNNEDADADGAEGIHGAGETTLMAGGLETSGTDLATEISEMITTQRGYQANTRIITVTDSMLEELVNMKR